MEDFLGSFAGAADDDDVSNFGRLKGVVLILRRAKTQILCRMKEKKKTRMRRTIAFQKTGPSLRWMLLMVSSFAE